MSSDEYDSESPNFDEESSSDPDKYDGKKNIAVIVIDNGPKMFIKPEKSKSSPFKICIQAIYEILDGMLLRPYKRNISINLLQEEDFSISDLNDNLVETTKKILEVKQMSEDELKQKYERKTSVNLKATLMESLKQVFRLDKINPYVVILTNDYDPHSGDTQQYLGSKDVAESFPEKNVKLIVLPLTDKFMYEPIYKELLKIANDEDLDIDVYEENGYKTASDLVEILREIIKDKVRIHRFVFNIFDKAEKKLSMWVELRYFVKVTNLYHNIQISRVTNNEVAKDFIKKDKIDFEKKWIELTSGKKLNVERDEKLRFNMPYGLKFLYVNDKQTSIHRLEKRCFIIQVDEMQKGEKKKKLFQDIWKYCIEKNKVLVCGFCIPDSRSQPELVELIPDRFLSKPCFIGFFLINEDVCKLEVEPKTEYEKKEHVPVNKSLVDGFSDVIDKLKVKYNPDDWVDEALEKKSAILKAHLLDTEIPKIVKRFPSDFAITQKLGESGAEVEFLLESAKEPVKPTGRGVKRRN